MKYNYIVKGMYCSSCSLKVEKDLNANGKLTNVFVNVANSNVTFDSDFYPEDFEQEIIKKVKKSGYELLKNYNEDDESKALRIKKIELVVGSFFAILLFSIAMFDMLFALMGLSVPNILKKISTEHSFITSGVIQIILLMPLIYIGRSFYIRGFKNLIGLTPNMDSLVAVGTSAAIIYSLYLMFVGFIYKLTGGHLYFETAGIIIFLIKFGKFLEDRAKGQTSSAIKSLMNLQPKTALVLRKNKEITVDVDELLVNDVVLVKVGEKIPCDGIIIDGNSSIDESIITGESLAIDKSIGDSVITSSINRSGFLKIKVSQINSKNKISEIIKMIQQAQNSRAPIAKLADRISSFFVPTVIALAIISSLLWYFFGGKLIEGDHLEFALVIFMSVLIISCPCALGLATPIGITLGISLGAKNGILIRNAEALEQTRKTNTIVLDKTGTITQGKMKVSNIISFKLEEEELLKITASIEKKSDHPLGLAIIEASQAKNTKLVEVNDFKVIAGSGLTAKYDGIRYSLGNAEFIEKQGFDLQPYRENLTKYSKQGKSLIIVCSVKDGVLGFFAIADTIKFDSKEAVDNFKKLGITTYMLTGDNQKTANYIASLVGIENVIANVMPEDKANKVKDLQQQGKIVTMVGDGINDSIALAQSDSSIAIGAGTDVAIESSQIVLMKNNLNDVFKAIEISKFTIRAIKQNLVWAFIYNILGIPIAAGLLHLIDDGPLLNPMIAALAMVFSSISVILNTLRLKLINF